MVISILILIPYVIALDVWEKSAESCHGYLRHFYPVMGHEVAMGAINTMLFEKYHELAFEPQLQLEFEETGLF